jgi:hypothetical protein
VNNLPDRPRQDGELPERRITPQQFEQVIRRAAELQARGLESPDSEAMSEAEVLRIGREIGISPVHVRRALAESVVGDQGPATLGERVFGPAWVSASRAVPGDADAVLANLDEYLVRRERLAPVRRFAGRTIYEKARGMDLARILKLAQETLNASGQPMVGAGFKLRKARALEVQARPLEDGYSYLTLAVDLGNHRATTASVGALGGSGLGVAVGAVLGIAVDPLAVVLGAPVLAGGLLGSRSLHVRVAARVQMHLEALLDCVERGEPLVRPRARR